ncbi:MAG TPA: hypothetical protein VF904_08175 [Anaeromyxobacteraceae bacterium]
MRLPPLFARVRLQGRAHGLTLWLPLFVIWLLLLVLAPLVLVLLLATLLVAPRWRFTGLVGGVYATACELRGARVEVEGERGRVFIALH